VTEEAKVPPVIEEDKKSFSEEEVSQFADTHADARKKNEEFMKLSDLFIKFKATISQSPEKNVDDGEMLKALKEKTSKEYHKTLGFDSPDKV
jgi:hypothetical protein